MEQTKTYLFSDEITGEEFFVEAIDSTAAKAIAEQYFDEPKCLGPVSDYDAEMMGLDTY